MENNETPLRRRRGQAALHRGFLSRVVRAGRRLVRCCTNPRVKPRRLLSPEAIQEVSCIGANPTSQDSIDLESPTVSCCGAKKDVDAPRLVFPKYRSDDSFSRYDHAKLTFGRIPSLIHLIRDKSSTGSFEDDVSRFKRNRQYTSQWVSRRQGIVVADEEEEEEAEAIQPEVSAGSSLPPGPTPFITDSTFELPVLDRAVSIEIGDECDTNNTPSTASNLAVPPPSAANSSNSTTATTSHPVHEVPSNTTLTGKISGELIGLLYPRCVTSATSVCEVNESQTQAVDPSTEIASIGNSDNSQTQAVDPSTETASIGNSDNSQTQAVDPSTETASIGNSDNSQTQAVDPSTETASIGNSDNSQTQAVDPSTEIASIGNSDNFQTQAVDPSTETASIGNSDNSLGGAADTLDNEAQDDLDDVFRELQEHVPLEENVSHVVSKPVSRFTSPRTCTPPPEEVLINIADELEDAMLELETNTDNGPNPGDFFTESYAVTRESDNEHHEIPLSGTVVLKRSMSLPVFMFLENDLPKIRQNEEDPRTRSLVKLSTLEYDFDAEEELTLAKPFLSLPEGKKAPPNSPKEISEQLATFDWDTFVTSLSDVPLKSCLKPTSATNDPWEPSSPGSDGLATNNWFDDKNEDHVFRPIKDSVECFRNSMGLNKFWTEPFKPEAIKKDSICSESTSVEQSNVEENQSTSATSLNGSEGQPGPSQPLKENPKEKRPAEQRSGIRRFCLKPLKYFLKKTRSSFRKNGGKNCKSKKEEKVPSVDPNSETVLFNPPPSSLPNDTAVTQIPEQSFSISDNYENQPSTSGTGNNEKEVRFTSSVESIYSWSLFNECLPDVGKCSETSSLLNAQEEFSAFTLTESEYCPSESSGSSDETVIPKTPKYFPDADGFTSPDIDVPILNRDTAEFLSTVIPKTPKYFPDADGFTSPDIDVPILNRDKVEFLSKDDTLSLILGTGSFAYCELGQIANQEDNFTTVAIKRTYFAKDNPGLVREGRFLQYLQDIDVIPKFYGMVEYKKEPTLVVWLLFEEFSYGSTLRSLIRHHVFLRVSPKNWVSICWQLANGLKNLHRRKVIYNDLRATSILINREIKKEPTIKFMDLGMASYMYGIVQRFHPENELSMTHLAPEVKQGQSSSYKSDIFSLGVIFALIYKRLRIDGLDDIARCATAVNRFARPSIDKIIEQLDVIRERIKSDKTKDMCD